MRNTPVSWGSYVAAVRARLGWTRPALADKIKVGRSTVFNWETKGQRPEHSAVVERFVDATGVPLNEALAAAGMRPAVKPPIEPSITAVPMDELVRTINDWLTDPTVDAERKQRVRDRLRMLVALEEAGH